AGDSAFISRAERNHRSDKPEKPGRGAYREGSSPSCARQESAHGGQKVNRDQAVLSINFLNFRAEVEQYPGVHQNMQNAAVQKTRGHQPPPLVQPEDRSRILRPEEE